MIHIMTIRLLRLRIHRSRELNIVREYSCGYRGYDRSGIAPRYPFGYGLSYTSFEYSDMNVEKLSTDSVKVSFTIAIPAGSERPKSPKFMSMTRFLQLRDQ